MKTPKRARGARTIRPMAVNKSRNVMVMAKNTAKGMANKTLAAVDVMANTISQSTLIVKQGFVSALSAMRNADLLVKLSEQFSKRGNKQKT